MAVQKHYAGAKLREIRVRANLTQRAFSERLGVSLPYLNQMENDNRPVSATVILALAREFEFDVNQLQGSDEARHLSDLKEALKDPVFGDAPISAAELKLAVANAPNLMRSLIHLHGTYRQTHDRLAALDQALGLEETRLSLSPWEEVRDFFHYRDNYIDAIDHAAEEFTTDAPDLMSAIDAALQQHGISTALEDLDGLRAYDTDRRTLTLSSRSHPATRRFQTLLQIALVAHHDLLEATLDLARFRTPEARDIARIGLANYFAGAAMMPYRAFLQAARETRHDLERLADRFEASIEQIAHRLSTLQRPGAKGVPFFFVRVDQAGTITKRHSATQLHFARFGGACPLWNVHRAFETPGRFLRQLAETPDGTRYLSIARDVSKSGGAFTAPIRRYAIALGCELRHAPDVVYSDGLDLGNSAAFEPIGISCRICERTQCHQRAVPPLEHKLDVDPNQRGVLPYRIALPRQTRL
ncbi:helix-turn-helix domain-containing protein [Aestuariibius insulae]|uniref:helix-turn-helix domain-containing protein n=1 Tax=Aestuariibius insulae TaxID=2058287 RepID=UPI00345EACAE